MLAYIHSTFFLSLHFTHCSGKWLSQLKHPPVLLSVRYSVRQEGEGRGQKKETFAICQWKRGSRILKPATEQDQTVQETRIYTRLKDRKEENSEEQELKGESVTKSNFRTKSPL